MNKLHILTGRAGSGKSIKIFNEIADSMDKGGDIWRVLLVPDQFTLQTERDLINHLQLDGLIDVEVLGFGRFIQRLQEENGLSQLKIVDEHGRRMMIKGACAAKGNQLQAFAASYQKIGFLQKIEETISAAKSFGLKPNQILSAAQSTIIMRGMQDKLKDVALLWQTLEESSEALLSQEDLLQKLQAQLDDSKLLAGAEIWLDGFNSLSKSEAEFVVSVARRAERVCCTFTHDESLSRHDRYVFRPTAQAVDFLNTAAAIQGVSIQKDQLPYLAEKAMPSNVSAYIEERLFDLPVRPVPEGQKGLRLVAARNPESEVEDVAINLLRRVQNNGIKWQDVQVLCAEPERYFPIISRVFPLFHIPFFLDTKRTLIHNSAVRFLIAAGELALGRFHVQEAMVALKAGFVAVPEEDLAFFENYCLANGMINLSRWRRDWSISGSEEATRAEALKRALMPPFFNLYRALHTKAAKNGSKVEKLIGAYEKFIREVRFIENVKEYAKALQLEGEYEAAAEFAQIPQIIENLFEQMALIGEECELTSREYLDLLQAGLVGSELGLIPANTDCVAVGDLVRTRARRADAVYVLGANDGSFPKSGSGATVFADDELEIMSQIGLCIGMPDDSAAQQLFGIYSSLVRSRSWLQVSYSLADETGKALRPAYLFSQLRHLFPDLKEELALTSFDLPLQEQLAPFPGLYTAAQHLREFNLHGSAALRNEPWPRFVQYFQNDLVCGQIADKCRQGASYSNLQHALAPHLAEQMYASPITTYPSRLELYAACPFAHFARYGLRPHDREVHELRSNSIGNILHQVFAQAGPHMRQAAMDKNPLEFYTALQDILQNNLVEYQQGIFTESSQGAWQQERITEAMLTFAEGIYQHVAESFTPQFFEARFGTDAESAFPGIRIVKGDIKIVLKGFIDRVDVWQAPNGSTFARIIDYKTGADDATLGMMLNGLHLQLPLYLKAVTAKFKPAGMFISPLRDNFTEVESEDQEIDASAALRLSGYVLDEAEVLRGMDSNWGQGVEDSRKKYNSPILDLSKGRNANLLSEKGLEKLFSAVENKVADIAGEIQRGSCLASPYSFKEKTACDYCDYRSLCQFDQRLPGNGYRRLQLESEADIAAILNGGGENDR